MRLVEQIANLDPISLAEIAGAALLNRTDTKYVIARRLLPDLIALLGQEYRIMEIEDERFFDYKTLYFDTPDFHFFNEHQRGKKKRIKVRFRQYVQSDLTFLEIKKKYKGRTDKSRIKIPGIEEKLSVSSKDFIDEVTGQALELEAKLWNSFTRLTLVHRLRPERLTIDLDLGFSMQEKSQRLPNAVIVEVKRGSKNQKSEAVLALKKLGIRQMGMSKYCIGSVLLCPSLKYNNFKPKIRHIQKLQS